MFVVCKLPGKGQQLSQSMQDQILVLALLWARELRRRPLPPMYSCGIRYQPEPADSLAEEWVDPYTVKERGFADCDDFVIWRLAEILNESNWTLKDGIQTLPAWPCIAWLKGTGRYHVLIRHRAGDTLEDPAKLMLKKYGDPPEEHPWQSKRKPR